MSAIPLAIVGAGAAGLATAIFARRLRPDRPVLLLDSARRIGAKILVSGGSRCNITNRTVTPRDFWGGRAPAIKRVLNAWPADQTVQFFAELGIGTHEEADGKLFPDSNRSRDVVDALLRESDRLGVALVTGHRVTGLSRSGPGFRLTTTQGEFTAERVVLATGGRSLPKSGSDGAGYAIAAALGHTIVPTTPALAPLVLAPGASAIHQRLSGVSHESELTLWVDARVTHRLRGPLLWTHFGVSGPVALNMSRHWARAALDGGIPTVTLSLCPGDPFDRVDEWLVSAIRSRPKAGMATLLSDRVPAALAAVCCEVADLPAQMVAGQLTRDDRRRLARTLTEWPLPIVDTRGYTYAEVTAGGVALDEIDATTMESRVCPGLYLVGEILDVDGRLGGFNFQWAWSSAMVAARALARAGTDQT